jgi:MFS family permease
MEMAKKIRGFLLTPKTAGIVTWLIAAFFAFFQFFLQTATSVMGAEWMQDFGLNKIGLGNLSAAFFYTYVLAQIPVGILYDRYQPRNILALAALLLSCSCFLLAETTHYEMAFLARLMMGAGSACGFIGMLKVCADVFPPKKFAFMIGVSEGGAMLGVTFSIILLTWLMMHSSWRVIMYGCSGVTFVLMLGAIIFIPQHEVMASSTETIAFAEKNIISAKIIWLRLKVIFVNRQVILGSLYGFFIFAIINAFTSLWGITFLIHTQPITKQAAANLIAMIFIGITIGGPGCGWLSKKLNKQRIILILGGIAATVTMTSIIFFAHSLPVQFGLFFLIGLFCSAYLQCFAIIKDSVVPQVRATAMATVNMVIMLGAPVYQLVIGWFLESNFFGLTHDTAMVYRLSLAILPLGMLIAFVLSFWLKEPVSNTAY